MRVVSYLRVSTDRQAQKDLSLPAQRETIKKWAEQHGAEIVREFVDAGESARTADRPGFLDLIAFCRNTPGLDAVAVYALDRFSRSRLDHAVFRNILKKVGVRVIAVTTPLDESPESIILEGVLETFSEYYSANLSRIIARGMRQAVERKGSRPGGTIPYGYRSVRTNGRVTLEVVPVEAATVRRMVDFALRGIPLLKIAKQLDAEGIRNRSGRRFPTSQVHRILHNPAIVGDLRWNRQRHGKGQVEKPLVEWVTISNAWPGIISRDAFAKVQVALAERAPTEEFRRRPSAEYLLTGFLVCGKCGAAYSVEQTQNGRYRYYNCARRMKEGIGTCPGQRLPLDTTNKQVLTGLLDWLFEEKRAAKIAAHFLKYSGVDLKALDRRRAEYCRWETELAARRERLLDALEEGKIASDILKERLLRLDGERAKLDAERTELERLNNRVVPLPTVEMFRSLGQELRKRMEEGPVAAAKTLLSRFVTRIVVKEGVLNAELVTRSVRQNDGSGDEFVTTKGWWS